MGYVDRLILLAILGGVAGLLIFLLRRVMRPAEADEPPNRIGVQPIPVAQPSPAKMDAPAIVAAQPPASVAVVEAKVRKRKFKNALAPAVAVPPVQTPIMTVLDMLKQKDTLAVAFLLREILAPPVSKRG